MEYTELSLEELCTRITDGAHWSPRAVSCGVPMASVKDMDEFGINIKQCKHISHEDYELLVKSDCKPLLDDVLIAKDGSYLKHVFVWKHNIELAILSSIAILRPNKNLISPDYLAAYLSSPIVRASMSNYVTGAALPRIILKDFSKFKLSIPPLESQRKVAIIISSYNNLIINNNRRIQILEEMAQLIYREWFVHYRFPGFENGRMVDSGSEFGEIPEGWEVSSLDGVLKIIESGSRPKGGIDPNEIGIPSIGAENILGLGKYDFTKEKFVSQTFFENMNRGIVKSGDVLLYKDGAQIGRKSLFRDDFPHKVCCVNEHVFILRTNNRITQSYLYFWLDLSNITQMIINLNSNAAQPGINQSKVKSLPIIVPNRKIVCEFDSLIDPILSQLFNLSKVNENLKKTRDLLLPKLISGELDVSDLNIDIE